MALKKEYHRNSVKKRQMNGLVHYISYQPNSSEVKVSKGGNDTKGVQQF